MSDKLDRMASGTRRKTPDHLLQRWRFLDQLRRIFLRAEKTAKMFRVDGHHGKPLFAVIGWLILPSNWFRAGGSFRQAKLPNSTESSALRMVDAKDWRPRNLVTASMKIRAPEFAAQVTRQSGIFHQLRPGDTLLPTHRKAPAGRSGSSRPIITRFRS